MTGELQYRFPYILENALQRGVCDVSSFEADNNINRIIKNLISKLPYPWKEEPLKKVVFFLERLSAEYEIKDLELGSRSGSIHMEGHDYRIDVSSYNADILVRFSAGQENNHDLTRLEELVDGIVLPVEAGVYKYVAKDGLVKGFSQNDGKFIPSLRGFIGVDVGSVSTNVVFLDCNNNVIELVYAYTRGRVLDALKIAFDEMQKKLPQDTVVLGVGVTGSSGELAKSILNADIYRTEIYSHAAATILQLPQVKTILEIGGQDSKVIFVNNGIPEKSKMNEWCGAGTGAMLDAQASRMGIGIEELGEYALRAKKSIDFRTRCGVFMASCMIDAQAHGYPIEVIISGLCKACAYNYINTLGINRKQLEHPIVFQGGVASNEGVKKELAEYIADAQGKPCELRIPIYHHVMGAIGMGIIAFKNYQKNNIKTAFRGFEGICRINSDIAVCDHRDCEKNKNPESMCDLVKLRIGDKTIATLGACDKYPEELRKSE